MSKPLPNAVLFKLSRDRANAYIVMIGHLIDIYRDAETDQEKLVLILLERMRLRLKQTELLFLQEKFRVQVPVEQALALYTALKECGGIFSNNWMNAYYIQLMTHIDPILN
jgi:predicted metalloenzyme YecM